MQNHAHHAHIFASDVDRTVRFYVECFGGSVVADMQIAGARNIFMRVGSGRIHLYDQAPKDEGRGPIHHLGIQTDNLTELVAHMKSLGIPFRKEITEFSFFRYVMVSAPDNVLLELFEVKHDQISPELSAFFSP